MTHWLLVNSPHNFELSRRRGFDIAGMKTRWAKAAREVAPGDTVFFYLTGEMAIGGEALVTGAAYEDYEPVWACSSDEYYPWRFTTEPTVIRREGEYLNVRGFKDRYAYARKWPAKNWTLAFQGNVHRLPLEDYQLVHSLLAGESDTL